MKSLLAEGVDASLRYCGIHEISALDVAALMGNLEVARLLLDHGVDANDTSTTGQTVLHTAVFHGRADLDLIDLLIFAGADIDAPAAGRLTPLHVALVCPAADDAAVILLRRGAAKDAITTSGGYSPLHLAAQARPPLRRARPLGSRGGHHPPDRQRPQRDATGNRFLQRPG